MMRFILFAALSICYVHCLPYLSPEDINILKANFQEQLASDRIEIAFYSAAGLHELGEKFESKQCKLAQDKAQNPKDLTELHSATGLANLIGASCKITSDKVKELTDAVFTNANSKPVDVYYATRILKSTGATLDENKVATSLSSSIAKDDSANGLTYAFNTALLIDAKHSKSLTDKIEDLVGQADEIDSLYKQIDGSIVTTAMAVTGIFGIMDRAGLKTSAIKADDTIKFANYIMSKRGVRNPKSAYYTLLAINALAKNKYQVPISVTLVNPGTVVNDQTPRATVHISDMLGNSVNPVSVTALEITFEGDMKQILTRQQFSPVSSTNTLYAFTLIDEKSHRNAGFYTISIQVNTDKDPKYIGGMKATRLQVKVTTKGAIKNAEIYVHDHEVTQSASNTHKVTAPSTLSTKLSASNHDKIGMKFDVQDTQNKNLKPHQAFAIFTHVKTGQEIIFVAEPNKDGAIMWSTDLSKQGKDFGYLSGVYSIRLVVGDPAIENGVNWHVADVDIEFKNAESTVTPSDDKWLNYKAAKEILHTFREPDKRPSQTLSDLFSLLCLGTILIMLIAFLRIGAFNFGNMPLTPFTLGFHAGLGGILLLYFTFWLRLNMFTTLKYLALIGAVTFICGNRMLAAMAARRKSKEEKSE